MILPVFFVLSILLFTFKKGSGGPAMELLGTGTGRRKASFYPFIFLPLKAFFSPPGAQDKG